MSSDGPLRIAITRILQQLLLHSVGAFDRRVQNFHRADSYAYIVAHSVCENQRRAAQFVRLCK